MKCRSNDRRLRQNTGQTQHCPQQTACNCLHDVCSLQTACNRQNVTICLQLTACNRQNFTRCSQQTACNCRHDVRSLQAACNRQKVTRCSQHTVCNCLHDVCSLQTACNRQNDTRCLQEVLDRGQLHFHLQPAALCTRPVELRARRVQRRAELRLAVRRRRRHGCSRGRAAERPKVWADMLQKQPASPPWTTTDHRPRQRAFGTE